MKFMKIFSIATMVSIIIIICVNTALIFIYKDFPFLRIAMDLILIIPLCMFEKLRQLFTIGKEGEYKDEIDDVFKKMETYKENQNKIY